MERKERRETRGKGILVILTYDNIFKNNVCEFLTCAKLALSNAQNDTGKRRSLSLRQFPTKKVYTTRQSGMWSLLGTDKRRSLL